MPVADRYAGRWPVMVDCGSSGKLYSGFVCCPISGCSTNKASPMGACTVKVLSVDAGEIA